MCEPWVFASEKARVWPIKRKLAASKVAVKTTNTLCLKYKFSLDKLPAGSRAGCFESPAPAAVTGMYNDFMSRSFAGSEPVLPLSKTELTSCFQTKYGPPSKVGWGPRLRLASDYFTPDDHYETLVARLVTPRTRWLDVACGRDIFPDNRALARLLADRCEFLMGIDPDPTLAENPFVHAKASVTIDDFKDDRSFDLVTLRMVAEHISEPDRAAASLAQA